MKKSLKYVMLMALLMTFSMSNISAKDDNVTIKDVFAKLLQVEDIRFYLIRADEITNGEYRTLTRTDEWMSYPVLVDDVFVAAYDMPFIDAPEDAQFFIVYPERYGYVIIHEDNIYVNHIKGSNVTFDAAIDTDFIFDMAALDDYADSEVYDALTDKIHVIPDAGAIEDVRMDGETIREIAESVYGKSLNDEEIEWTIAPVTLNPVLPEASMRSPYTMYVMTIDDTDTYFSLLPDNSIRVYPGLPLDLDNPKFTDDTTFSLEETKRVLTDFEVYQLDK